jgi:hypothetical protein
MSLSMSSRLTVPIIYEKSKNIISPKPYYVLWKIIIDKNDSTVSCILLKVPSIMVAKLIVEMNNICEAKYRVEKIVDVNTMNQDYNPLYEYRKENDLGNISMKSPDSGWRRFNKSSIRKMKSPRKLNNYSSNK